MEKAIISGANGLVGSAIARLLVKRNIDVLCLGRAEASWISIAENQAEKLQYLKIDTGDIASLCEKMMTIKWDPGRACVFYNCAWGGNAGLTDGGIERQLMNAAHSANSVVVAKEIGCVKFVNVGSMEETFAEIYLKEWEKRKYTSPQKEYAVAKIASRDMCILVAYLRKIDYVHTRLSVPISPYLDRGGYIRSVFLRIKQGMDYENSVNEQLFDITSVEDVAYAYYLIGKKGKNKADYYIGAAAPRKLGEYFRVFSEIKNGGVSGTNSGCRSEDSGVELFDTALLQADTGFILKDKFEDLAKRIIFG